MSIHKLVVVGGVAGGASCAARARRLNEEAEIVLLERGPYVSFANCGLPYHIGGVIEQRDRLLVQTPERLKKMFRLDVRVRHEVIRIDRENHQVGVRDRATGREYTESYDALALSPGAEPVRPPIPGVESARVCTLRNMEDMDGILSILGESSTRSAVVVGGGYIGLEMAEALCERGLKVALVELAPQVMGPADAEMAAPLHDELQRHGVNLRLETSVSAFQETENGLEVQLSTGDTLTCELAILAIGVKPEVRLAREAGLKIGALGGIAVDEYLRTSDPAIYAVGDAIETRDFVGGGAALLPLAGPANRQGRLVADHLFGHPRPWRGTQGTAICKVFGLAIALTGSSEKVLKRQGRTYEKIYVHPAHHAGYYPGATQFSLKLLFDPTDGRVLGAQAVGARGVDKRIDVLATAIQSGMTVFDLEETELSYAPPYGSAKDPVNFAAFVAANVLRGDMKVCHVEEVSDPQPHQWLLDVRTGAEVAAGAIPGAHNISVDELRSHLDEIPRDREILVY
ncbi:MAG TPA: FAD-dependent oxidoreductase, partial [Candidatus Sumerlaeota bacterium]|nr:FAD-dependent oxidoreductase [Candidatus Sumerlaeota bacterium]